MLQRRNLIASLAILAAGDPKIVSAQPAKRVMRVGFLSNVSTGDGRSRALFDAFLAEMRRLGWVDGSNVIFDFRNVGGGQAELAPAVREFVASKVDVIAAMSASAALVAKRETSTIPIVFIADQPIEYGLISSLRRPGGNLTGLTSPVDALMPKRMQILTQALPGIRRIAYLGMNEARSIALARSSAQALEVDLLSVQVTQPEDLARAVVGAASANGWLVDDYAMFHAHMSEIISLIEAQRKPAVYGSIYWMRKGGLLAYSADVTDIWRRSAGHVDRVLRGAIPSEMPVEEPVRYLLGVNLRAARRIGIAIAKDVLLQADEVVQ